MNICLQMVAPSVLMNAEVHCDAQFLKQTRAAERFKCVHTWPAAKTHVSTDRVLGRWTLSYKQHTALPDRVTLVLTTSYYGKYDILSWCIFDLSQRDS